MPCFNLNKWPDSDFIIYRWWDFEFSVSHFIAVYGANYNLAVDILDSVIFFSCYWNSPSKMWMGFSLTFCMVAWISLCSADDVVVQMFSKKPVNVISDKYISYSIDPTELLEMNQDREWVIVIWNSIVGGYSAKSLLWIFITPINWLVQFFRENFLYRMMESGPCYLKIYGNNTNRMRLDGDSIDLNSSKLPLDRLKSVYDVLR